MSKLKTTITLNIILTLLLQTCVVYGQFQSPANLNIGNVIQAARTLGAAFNGNGMVLDQVLGSSPGDGPAALAKMMELKVGPECVEHTMAMVQGVQQADDWAMRMLDAIGKPPSGLLQGKITWLGDYDECRDVTGPQEMFKGQYCNVDFDIGLSSNSRVPMLLSIGVCVPNSCTTADVIDLATIISNVTGPYLTTSVNMTMPSPSAATCQADTALDTRAIVVLCICGIFVFVMVVATFYDVIYVQWLSRTLSLTAKSGSFSKPDASTLNGGSAANGVHLNDIAVSLPEKHTSDVTTEDSGSQPRPEVQVNNKRESGTAAKLLLSFSMFSNATKILNTSQPKGALTAVNGIRFLSMSWVIVGHSFSFIRFNADNPAQFFTDYSKRFLFMPIINGTFSVDSFFVLSGLLLTYLTLKELKKRDSPLKFNWGLFYFHRLWRLTPPYMLCLLVYVSLNMYWGNGPMWSPTGIERGDCDTWWTNLLYINNIVHSDKMCYGWAWYLANDMQFFVLSPLMIVPLFIFPIAGSALCLLFLLVGIVSSAVTSVHYNLAPKGGCVVAEWCLTRKAWGFMDLEYGCDRTDTRTYMTNLYYVPWCRVGPYALGVFAGYLLYKYNMKKKIPVHINVAVWLIASTAALLVIYGLYSDDGTFPLSDNMTHAYIATSRSIWGACIAWVIFACATGNGGPVNHILSWPGFVPLGRLSYCAYLVHPFIMIGHDRSMRTMLHAYDYSLIYLTLGHLCMSYAVAFVVSLAFEAPMMGIEKVLLGRTKNS